MQKLTEQMAKRLAARDKGYGAIKLRGEWLVWCNDSDHAVEFDSAQIAAVAAQIKHDAQIAAEKTAAGRIIDRALAKGYLISVNDGEEWTVKKSVKRREIMDALQSTDADYLMIRAADGAKIGTIYLVWGNSPDEIVCDCTDKPEIAELTGF